MEWNDSHKNPPKNGDKVYYFGPNIGIWVGHYKYDENQHLMLDDGKKVPLCPHLFIGAGVVDACDAPFWLPFSVERENEGWRPIVPTKYTKGLYD